MPSADTCWRQIAVARKTAQSRAAGVVAAVVGMPAKSANADKDDDAKHRSKKRKLFCSAACRAALRRSPPPICVCEAKPAETHDRETGERLRYFADDDEKV